MLVVVTVLAVVLGWVHHERELVRKEKVAIAWVNEVGGQAYVQEAYGRDPRAISWWEERTKKWFGEKVETVHLMSTYVSDLTPLAELSRLESVYLGGTEVTDLSPLAGLESLDTVSLTWGAVSDLSPLAKVTSLEVLELDQTQVSDLSPLAELTDLRILCLAQT